MKKKTPPLNVANVITIAVLLIVGALIAVRSQHTVQQAPVVSPSPEIIVQQTYMDGTACTGQTVRDTDAGFSIVCPQDMQLFVVDGEYNQFQKRQEKRALICEGRIIFDQRSNLYSCETGGIYIWANGDGWGGGCDAENHATIIIDGKKASYCLYPTGFGQLYAGDMEAHSGQGRFYITGNFSGTFTKEKATTLLSTFHVLK